MCTVALNNRITSNAQEGGMKNRAIGLQLVSLISVMEGDRRINLAWPPLMHTFLSIAN